MDGEELGFYPIGIRNKDATSHLAEHEKPHDIEQQ